MPHFPTLSHDHQNWHTLQRGQNIFKYSEHLFVVVDWVSRAHSGLLTSTSKVLRLYMCTTTHVAWPYQVSLKSLFHMKDIFYFDFRRYFIDYYVYLWCMCISVSMVCIYVYVYPHVCSHGHICHTVPVEVEGQLSMASSVLPLWVPGTELRLSVLHSNCFTHLHHFTGPI